MKIKVRYMETGEWVHTHTLEDQSGFTEDVLEYLKSQVDWLEGTTLDDYILEIGGGDWFLFGYDGIEILLVTDGISESQAEEELEDMLELWQ